MKEVYGFATVDDLESAWIEWLKVTAKTPKGHAAPKQTPRSKANQLELIPPTKLPGDRKVPLALPNGF